jgi:predicted nucleic-acid-binding protein
MVGLDTNVLVRFLVRDDAEQFLRACRLIEGTGDQSEEILVSLNVLMESEWVLRTRYGVSKGEILGAISAMLDTERMWLEDEPTVEEALVQWQDSVADFADCLIGARNRRLGCRATVTFDAKAARLPGFVAL